MKRACLFALLTAMALADPCGMVPPIFTGDGPPITRIGLQQTYVFYQDGVECIAIRPGFEGKVEDFGMLIPFPSPPALRKLPDDIFGHLAAAVDPPEVVEYLYRWELDRMSERAGGGGGPEGLEVQKNEVRVLREEAVGMYEVAVLEAGSAAALNRWMDDHGYVYPEGMDAPCEDYIEDGWCFVAIKTRVGPKSAVDPAPGQRETSPGLPAGGSFDGHVQAMGFRFRTPELVVPMRLSAFNEGELRNIVYVLGDQPLKIVDLPEDFVRRQLSGAELLVNLRELRPLRIVGGGLDELTPARYRELRAQRAPEPVNGLAALLFAGDLEAAASGSLSHEHEQREKELLNIGEHLGLRGPAVDALHAAQLAEAREQQRERALQRLEGMTLTVIDGDFPREHLATTNLTFASYAMPAERNQPRVYHCGSHGAPPPTEGSLVDDGAQRWQEEDEDDNEQSSPLWWSVFPGLALGVWLLRRLRGKG